MLVLLVFIASFPTEGPAQTRPELKIWTARAIATVLAEIGPEFERSSGYRLTVTSDLSTGFVRRMTAGEGFDVIVSAAPRVEEWIREGRVLGETRVDIARSGIGVEVREGAARPDISSAEAFKQALLRARSIAYLRVGSGIHVDSVIARLGIAEAIAAKVTRPETDIVSELVARDEVELGIVVITQILTTPGVALVGPLPQELQSHVMFTGAVSARSPAPAVARQLLRFLTGATAAPVIRRQGMEPAQ